MSAGVSTIRALIRQTSSCAYFDKHETRAAPHNVRLRASVYRVELLCSLSSISRLVIIVIDSASSSNDHHIDTLSCLYTFLRHNPFLPTISQLPLRTQDWLTHHNQPNHPIYPSMATTHQPLRVVFATVSMVSCHRLDMLLARQCQFTSRARSLLHYRGARA
jgi:hypothetical protein